MMIGKRLSGRYKVLEVIGGGGMAVVYKAQDLILGRPVAVKVLRSEFSEDEQLIRRFKREAESAASLSHPGIVTIYDIGEEDGLYFIVFEYVAGMTLKEYIRRFAPVSPEKAVEMMEAIASAIAHAHEHGIVHRDIKPHNILVTDEGDVKVTDFGIALAMTSGTITHTNSVLGSAHYFSPEQARGGYADVKSDIYSLGVVFFELVTGELPFSGTSPVSVALKHLQETIPRPRELRPDLPQSIENIILKALEKDPFHRYEDIWAFQRDLHTALLPERRNEPVYHRNDDSAETTKVMPPLQQDQRPKEERLQEKKANGGKKENNQKKWKRWLLPLVLFLLVLGGGVVAAFTVIPDLLAVEDVTVPDVTGMTYERASHMLKQRELNVRRENVFHDTVEKGKVVRQNPEARSVVKKGTSVRLFVSKGPKRVNVDNYVGKSRDVVERLLQQTDFDQVEWIAQHSNLPEGQVIDQEPDAGTRVIPQETTLTFTYSSGPRFVTVPDLSGKTAEEARSLLAERGLTPVFHETYSAEIEEEYVIRQSPEPYAESEPGSEVEVWISLGPPPEEEEHGDEEGNGKTPPEQEPIVFDQPVTIQVKKKDEGKEIPVQIYYSDANHTNELAVDTVITKTETFVIEAVTIEPGGTATIVTVVNGNRQEKTYTYEEMAKKRS